MSILQNAKHEAMALALADGLSQEKAYIKAGFAPKNARSGATKLLQQNPNIFQRRDEILVEREALRSKGAVAAAEKEQVTKAYVLRGLKTIAERCLQTAPVLDRKGDPVLCETMDGGVAVAYQFDPTGANRSLELLGKEIGMFIERKEQGKPGEFAGLTDEQLDAEVKEAIDLAIKSGAVRALRVVKAA